MLKEVGVDLKIRVKTDAAAAKGIATRRGMGKVRHIEVNQLWVQEKVANGELKIEKRSGLENLADHLTKCIAKEGLAQHMHMTDQWIEAGRRETHQLQSEGKGTFILSCLHALLFAL